MSRLEKKSGKSELAGDRINRGETNGKRGAFIFFFFFFFSFDFKSPIRREEEEEEEVAGELTRNGVESGVMTLLGQITGDLVAFDHFIKFSGFKGVAPRFGIHPFINPGSGISFNCSL